MAAFHPEGAKFAAYASGEKRASGMSYFNIGGNTGYALGAFVTGLLVAARARRRAPRDGPRAGRRRVLLRVAAALGGSRPSGAAPRLDARGRPARAMALLGVVIALRSIAWFTLLAFVPLWVVAHGHSKATATGCSS